MGNTPDGMRIVSLKLPRELDEELTRIARSRNATRSAVIREALEKLASGRRRRSVTAVAGDLVGSLRGPRDLSTNRKHLAGYGE